MDHRCQSHGQPRDLALLREHRIPACNATAQSREREHRDGDAKRDHKEADRNGTKCDERRSTHERERQAHDAPAGAQDDAPGHLIEVAFGQLDFHNQRCCVHGGNDKCTDLAAVAEQEQEGDRCESSTVDPGIRRAWELPCRCPLADSGHPAWTKASSVVQESTPLRYAEAAAGHEVA
jgi:hypothetical protein